MSETTAKIAAILSSRKVTTANGDVWYYKLEMDNNDVGEIGKKKPDAFKAGDSLTYTVEESQYGKKFKAVQNGNGFRGGAVASRGGNESFALAYARDLTIAMIAKKEKLDKTPAELAEVTMAMADKFYIWLEGKRK